MKGKVTVITGVSNGIGRAIALNLRNHGCKVVGISRSQPDIELDLWVCADITIGADRERIRTEVEKCFGRVDLLVNNAGKGLYATWEELDEAELRSLFELNFFAVAALTREFLPLLKNSQGTIANISSVAGKIWIPCMGAYCASKSSVSMFSNSLRLELKKYSVKVLEVCPGQINTGFSSRSMGMRKPPDSPGRSAGPEALAEAFYRAWKRGKSALVYPGWMNWAVATVRGVFPWFYNHYSLKVWNLED
ncbi:MAG: SDR family NAD(P)-dependent oxidoreductase, partial [Victivallaceae bacterium]|mgnify:CR=1 FL=1|nr:SDR family NAD(P)-dependent oxidoreductase [Victivallaceae bacterium]